MTDAGFRNALRGLAAVWLLTIAVGGVLFAIGSREVGVAIAATAIFVAVGAGCAWLVLVAWVSTGRASRIGAVGLMLFFAGPIALVVLFAIRLAGGGSPTVFPSDPLYPVIGALGCLGVLGILVVSLAAAVEAWDDGRHRAAVTRLVVVGAVLSGFVLFVALRVRS